MTQFSISANGKILLLDEPVVMGILNITPDSFFDGGRYADPAQAVNHAAAMISAGAAIIDIGGMSSRPGAEIISFDEERKRVIPVLKAVRHAFPETWISIDTVRSAIVKEAADYGADMVNDISAGSIDPGLLREVGRLQLPYVLMHMQGVPESMQQDPAYENPVRDILKFLIGKKRQCMDQGIRDIIVDPGIGFGKTVSHNFQILRNLDVLGLTESPVLIGLSRKSMICKVLHVNPDNALNGTTALHMAALEKGARILRVHDVREARETIQLFKMLQEQLNRS